MNTTAQLAARAEKILGIEISITDSGRAYHYAEETGSAYWLTRADLRYAKDCAEEHPEDAYSFWCQSTGREMSARTQRRLLGR